MREAYRAAHIFAYPSIWQETSCRCLIEAMMAGCVCVHPNFAALPDTAGGLTDMYDGDLDMQKHAEVFANQLASIIQSLRTTDLYTHQGFQMRQRFMSHVATQRFGWPGVISKWKALLAEVKGSVLV